MRCVGPVALAGFWRPLRPGSGTLDWKSARPGSALPGPRAFTPSRHPWPNFAVTSARRCRAAGGPTAGSAEEVDAAAMRCHAVVDKRPDAAAKLRVLFGAALPQAVACRWAQAAPLCPRCGLAPDCSTPPPDSLRHGGRWATTPASRRRAEPPRPRSFRRLWRARFRASRGWADGSIHPMDPMLRAARSVVWWAGAAWAGRAGPPDSPASGTRGMTDCWSIERGAAALAAGTRAHLLCGPLGERVPLCALRCEAPLDPQLPSRAESVGRARADGLVGQLHR